MTWAVGVTSAPRRDPTLRACVDAIFENGWSPTVYAEPGTDVSGIRCAVEPRPHRFGVFDNWREMAISLASQDGVSRVLTVQDDCRIVPFARRVLEAFEWPERCAFVSLYLPDHVAFINKRYTRFKRPVGIQHIPQMILHGSVCLAWNVEALRLVLDHQITREWPGFSGRRYPQRCMVDDDDICIGNVVNLLKLEMWYAVPGLSQHISDYAARERDMGIRRSPWVAETETEFARESGCPV